MDLQANEIITIKQPFHIQLSSEQKNYNYKTTIPHALSLLANEIISAKQPFQMQWSSRHTNLLRQTNEVYSNSTL